MSIYWEHTPNNGKFDFYGFLRDDFFKGHNYKMAEVMKEISPHELWTRAPSQVVYGCGPKKEQVILRIMDEFREEYRRYGVFCECNEPLLCWYQFCPTCGKKVGPFPKRFHNM